MLFILLTIKSVKLIFLRFINFTNIKRKKEKFLIQANAIIFELKDYLFIFNKFKEVQNLELLINSLLSTMFFLKNFILIFNL